VPEIGGRVGEVAGAHHREDRIHDGKDQDQQNAEIEGRHGQPQKGENAVEIVHEAVALDGGRNSQGNTEEIAEQDSANRQFQGVGQDPFCLRGDRVTRNGRMAHAAAGKVP
jgi:hypothetical protein